MGTNAPLKTAPGFRVSLSHMKESTLCVVLSVAWLSMSQSLNVPCFYTSLKQWLASPIFSPFFCISRFFLVQDCPMNLSKVYLVAKWLMINYYTLLQWRQSDNLQYLSVQCLMVFYTILYFIFNRIHLEHFGVLVCLLVNCAYAKILYFYYYSTINSSKKFLV